MREKYARENLFDLDSLSKSHWRSRINAFKRELKSEQGRPAVSAVSSRRRYISKRRPARTAVRSMP